MIYVRLMTNKTFLFTGPGQHMRFIIAQSLLIQCRYLDRALQDRTVLLYTLPILALIVWLAYRFVRKEKARRRRLREEELAAQHVLRAEKHRRLHAESGAADASIDFGKPQPYNKRDNHMITVQEKASVKCRPDTIRASIGINTREKDYESCQQILDRRTNRIVQELRNLNLDDLAIATSDYHIHPDYDYDRKIFNKRFNSSHEFHAQFKYTPDSLKAFYSTVFKEEARAEVDVEFALVDTESARKEAIQKAVVKAQATVAAVAESAGIQVGRIVSIKPEVVVGKAQHHRYGGTEALMRAASLSSTDGGAFEPGIQAGELEVVAVVTMRCKIEN